ncbi:hypothetical protein [Slackia heliotrinireducens]|uniref:Uncharacterized protein n=2 Tax=Slackia TaxID=84108 RepID=C7N1G8_SLAHD|nr:hypothetical protein [Slackia heliotrinireducens]ACV21260.1 hypothetical protein Shel_01900 [Slackia heliotrinireducens DSM 20476]
MDDHEERGADGESAGCGNPSDAACGLGLFDRWHEQAPNAGGDHDAGSEPQKQRVCRAGSPVADEEHGSGAERRACECESGRSGGQE